MYVQAFTLVNSDPSQPIITFLKNKAFTGEIYSFDEVMVHESVHGSGVGQHYYYFLGFIQYGHDLTGYDPYPEILKNCTIPQESK